MIQKSELPTFSKILVEEVFLNRLPNNNYWYFFLLTQYAISKVLCANRVYIESKTIDTRNAPPNLFAMLFSDSGVGKGRSQKILKDCMQEFNTDFSMRSLSYADTENEKIEAYILLQNMTKGLATQYRQENSPRFIKQEIDSNATLEGFLDSRLALQQAKFGCSCWEDSEISDTMKGLQKGDRNAKEFIKYNKEAYDHGFSEAKIIKSNKKPKDIEGIPHLTCLYGALDEEEGTELFKTFFDLGFARRCIVFYETDTTKTKKEITQEMVDKAIEGEAYAVQMFKELNEKFKPLSQIEYPYSRIAICPDHETELRYFRYTEECETESEKHKGFYKKGVRIELANRPWKALKLATVLFCQDISENTERSQKYTMPVSYFLIAEKILEIYGNQFKSFYTEEGQSVESKLFEYIIEKENVSKTDLTKSRIITGTYQQRSSVVFNLIDRGAFADYLETKGYELIITESGKTKKALYYSIVKIKEEEKPENITIHISQSETNGEYDTTFIPRTGNFFDVHKIIQEDKNYSPSIFNGNYRRAGNWNGKNDLIILDCDNEVQKESEQLTIAKAQELLKDYAHLIMPTKSHKTDKKGYGVRERFRIIILTFPMEDIDSEEHKDILKNIVKSLKLSFKYTKKIDGKDCKFFWIDEACFEVAHKYHGFNSDPHYNKGSILNWRMYRSQKPRYIEKRVFTNKETNFKNPFDKNTVLEIKGRPMQFSEYLSEAKNKDGTLPCKCPFHEDESPSAFITINKHGDFQFTCIPCGINQFCKV